MLTRRAMSLLNSTSVWTLVFLLVIELLVRLSAPPAAKNIVDGSTRIGDFKQFCRQKHNADVAILGSSLALAATFERGGQSDRNFFVDDWSKSISQNIRRDVKVVNLAWHAGMIADCNKTIKAYLHSQNRPQVVLLMTAPRDFSDNLTAQTGVLAGYSVERDNSNLIYQLQKAKSLDSLTLVLAEIVLPGTLLNQLISNGEDRTVTKALNTVVAYYSETFKDHKTAHDKMFNFCGKLLRRPENLASATNFLDKTPTSTTVNASDFSPFERDIAMYRQRYNPTNANSMKQAGIELKELKETCVVNGICLIILNMPLTCENLALITPDTYSKFIDKLNSVTSASNCLFIDASKNSNFTRADFHDSVHLNRSGQEKLRELIIPVLITKLTDPKEMEKTQTQWKLVGK